MLGGVVFGHEQMQAAINAIHDLVRDAGKPDWDWQPAPKNEALIAAESAAAQEGLNAAYQIREKQARTTVAEVYAAVQAAMAEQAAGWPARARQRRRGQHPVRPGSAHRAQPDPQRRAAHRRPRHPHRASDQHPPGRAAARARQRAVHPCGETQALVVATLGTKQDEQIIDALMGEYRDHFMLHYNMPPFATGETGRIGVLKRREIGHGRLAKRALLPLLPAPEDFQYTIRLVSEITESNGSSSMASVCGGSLAMMDAGVPTNDHVAGVAMGLILDSGKFAVLTDILGDEDHLGDMDFKVAGTETGITALQMDIKIQGITKEIMQVALAQAREGRLHPRQDARRAGRLAYRAVGVRAAHADHQDQPREDPRRDRQGRRHHPCADRGNRHADRYLGRRHHRDRQRGRDPGQGSPAPHRRN